MTGVRELRLVVTADDHDEALRLHRDVDDSARTAREPQAAEARVVAETTRTPWNSLNAGPAAPAGSRLTRCTEPGGE